MTGRTGFIILAHHHLQRAGQLANALAAAGARVVLHIDRRCPESEFAGLRRAVARQANIIFCDRVAGVWGTFSLTKAAILASEALLVRWPDLEHVCQLSGDTLPVRPVADVLAFLQRNRGTDFIDSRPADSDNRAPCGLALERFRYWFPFAWQSRRRLFDLAVEIQRFLQVSRKLPDGITPHMGSQWWCLSAPTLRAILDDSERPRYEKYFRWCWIPDESFFQTLARKHSTRISAQGLVLNRFDRQGLPYVYYDDHAELLAASGEYFCRKVWHGADGLYRRFLDGQQRQGAKGASRVVGTIAAAEMNLLGRRPGLVMQSRFPLAGAENSIAGALGFDVIVGFDRIFSEFRSWFARHYPGEVHGHLFAAGGADFSSGPGIGPGCLSGEPDLRDHDPVQFLRNLLWSQRQRRTAFLFNPAENRKLAEFIASDAKARFHILAATLPEIPIGNGDAPLSSEPVFTALLSRPGSRADVRIWTVSDYIANADSVLQQLLERTCQPAGAPMVAAPERRHGRQRPATANPGKETAMDLQDAVLTGTRNRGGVQF